MFPEWMSVHHVCEVPTKGIKALEIGVTDDCEPSGGCQDLNPGRPEEQPVLLTTEPSIQS